MVFRAPDLAGFHAAQRQLYTFFGVPVTFLVPVEQAFDVSVPIDPFGDPLDAFATPASGGVGVYTEYIAASAVIVNRPFGGRGQVKDSSTGLTPIGRIGDAEIGLHILPEDYLQIGPGGGVGEATHAELIDQNGNGATRYEIRQWRAGGVGPPWPQRYEVYLREEGMG